MSYTPRPWEIREKAWKGEHVIAPPGNYAIAVVYWQRAFDKTPLYDADANARLIAAAPDLLEACENMVSEVHRYTRIEYSREWMQAAIQQLEDAIAKAKETK